MKYLLIAVSIVILLAVTGFLFFSGNNRGTAQKTIKLPAVEENPARTQYLAFQIFTRASDSHALENSIPPPPNVEKTVDDIISKIGMTGGKDRKLGFVPGPISFDDTDSQVRQLIRDSFAVAQKKNVAVGFHVDDSMFWGRLSELNKTENVEWLDWNKTPNTGRRLDWSLKPTKIMPQLCFNSPAVLKAVKNRAAIIGEEISRGIKDLDKAGKADLFLGVIAGWETQIGRDFETGKSSGYCALTNKGYSAEKPPSDIDEARAEIVKEFVDFWAKSLADAGVPDEKIFSHVAFFPQNTFDFIKTMQPGNFSGSYLETINFSPSRTAFGSHHFPGFSTYPAPGHLEEILAERTENGNPPWASSEGTAIDPSEAEKGAAGDSMEMYLGNLFNHGASVVNVFGWGVGDAANPFRKVAENKDSITAYQKFLKGEKLKEGVKPPPPSPQFLAKVRKLQEKLPPYLKANGAGKVEKLYKTFDQYLKAERYSEAEEIIDQLLKIIEE